MEDDYDVVIAGSGPAGGQAARDIAARGYDVLVLEAEYEEDFPSWSKKSTAGTFSKTLTEFGIPDDVVQNSTDRVVLESPGNSFDMEKSGGVLEFGDYKRWMAEDAQEKGAEYLFGARVNGPVLDDDGNVTGVRYNGDETASGEIVIDATGPAAPIATELGVADLPREAEALGVEYEMEGVDMEREGFASLEDAMMLRLGHDWAPGGYSWIFHTGEDTAKVGVCYLQNQSHEDFNEEGMGIEDYMDRMLAEDPRLEDAEKMDGENGVERHAGSAHIKLPESVSADSFMAVGDTAPTVDPVWGEGIDKCMRSGRAAATTVDAALKQDDTSAEAMSMYDELWHSEVAPNQSNRLAMTELLYMGSNDRYDEFMQQLTEMEPGTLGKLNQGDPAAIAKIARPSDVPMFTRFAARKAGRNEKIQRAQQIWDEAEETVRDWIN